MNSSSTSFSWPPKAGPALASSGAVALVLGLIFLIAFNWAGLPSLAKFGLLQGVVIALAIGALFVGLTKSAGKILLIMAMGCIGPLLAVFGQTYQTGADVWQLFSGWALLSVIWAVAARSAGGWLLWVILAQMAMWLRFHTYFDFNFLRIGTFPLWVAIVAVNATLLLIWELAAQKYDWLQGRFAPRLIAAVLVFAMTSTLIYSMFSGAPLEFAHPLVGWLLVMLTGYLWYAQGKRDIVMTVFCWVSIAAVVLVWVIKTLVSTNFIFAIFVGFITVLASLWFGITWIKKRFAGENHWAMSVAAGFGAWVAMLFFIAVLGVMFADTVAKSMLFWFVVFGLCTGIAIWLDRSKAESVFRTQLATVLCLAAPTAIYVAFIVANETRRYSENGFFALYASCAVALGLWVLLQSKFARSLMAIVVVFGIVIVLEQLHLRLFSPWLIAAAACAIWVFAPNSFITDPQEILKSADDVRLHRLTEFGYAATLWALLLCAGQPNTGQFGVWYLPSMHLDKPYALVGEGIAWLPNAFAFSLAIFVYFVLAKIMQKRLFSDVFFAILILLCTALTAWYAPCLLTCSVLLVLGICSVRLKLSLLATTGLVAALFGYYFEQATPLWIKGCVLFVLGALLLVSGWRVMQHSADKLKGVAL